MEGRMDCKVFTQLFMSDCSFATLVHSPLTIRLCTHGCCSSSSLLSTPTPCKHNSSNATPSVRGGRGSKEKEKKPLPSRPPHAKIPIK